VWHEWTGLASSQRCTASRILSHDGAGNDAAFDRPDCVTAYVFSHIFIAARQCFIVATDVTAMRCETMQVSRWQQVNQIRVCLAYSINDWYTTRHDRPNAATFSSLYAVRWLNTGDANLNFWFQLQISFAYSKSKLVYQRHIRMMQ